MLEAKARWKVEYVNTIDSTNDELKRRYQSADEVPRLVLVAREQTGGRGRLNRSWQSVPSKDITASVIFPNPVPAVDAPRLTLCAGLSLVRTLNDTFAIKSQIRWPNDILTDNGKLAGILSAYLSTPNAVICGIGINVNSEADDIDIGPFGKRTTIYSEIHEEVPLSAVLSSWILNFESCWELASAVNFIELAEQFNSVSFYRNKRVKVLPGAGNYREEDRELPSTGDEFDGVVTGISESGALRVETAPMVFYDVDLSDVLIPI